MSVFDRGSLGCVRIPTTTSGTRTTTSAPATWVRLCIAGVRIRSVLNLCRAVDRDSILRAVFVVYEALRDSRDKAKEADAFR